MKGNNFYKLNQLSSNALNPSEYKRRFVLLMLVG